ncbi:integrator complex subunit 1-like [Panonychus citri]|uniref:integrator complex subunit 1-like n=1 Tax=Panonychus citri TaxID=50023 RepID=UPI0023072829|nr:integrator complex subunit 1-like [Panonychus citri]
MSSVPGKRGGKSKVPLPATSSLFALGGTVAKRPKVLIGGSSGGGGSSGESSRLGSGHGSKSLDKPSDEWEDVSIDVEPEFLIKRIVEAEGTIHEPKIANYICGAVKQLRSSKIKPDSVLFLSLVYLAKTRPSHFTSEKVVDAMCSLLRRESPSSSSSFKVKVNSNVTICSALAANLLLAAHLDEPNWHLSFIKAYIEDSLGERIWVDSDFCRGFVDNILTAFNTKNPPKNLMSQDILAAVTGGTVTTPSSSTGPLIGGIKGTNESPISTSPSHASEDNNDETSSLFSSGLKDVFGEELPVVPRYNHNQQVVYDYVYDIINEQLTRRQVPSEINRNVLKLLISTVGIPQIRLLVAQKLEIWLQNPKLSRPAQDLLLAVCVNCTEEDSDVISALVKMRLKTKVLMNHFFVCIKELLSQSDGNIMIVLRNAISIEFSNNRGSSNMHLIAVIFQHSSNKATKCLAHLIQEFLIKDDFLRQIRHLLREIVKALKHEHINLVKLVDVLTTENSRVAVIDVQEVLSRVLTSIADIIVLCMFLTVYPVARESMSKPTRKDILKTISGQIAEMQRLAIIWMQKVVVKIYKPDRGEYMHCLNKCLLMEIPEHYYNKDNWPAESERAAMFQCTTKVPVHEDSLIRILKMGLSKDYPVQSPEAIELSDALIKRAAAIYDGDVTNPTLPIKKDDIFNLLLKNSIYRIPENITLPSGYEAPSLAINDWYWKVWLQLLIIVAHNAAKFGSMAWENYPTLALIIEMCITNHFEFPPTTRANEDLKGHEQQIVAIEKQQILQFEIHLAAASSKRHITEGNSLLLSKLITFDPQGKPRQPPIMVLETLKSINAGLRIGYWLCQSRNPDFLLEIIQRQQRQNICSANLNLGLGTMQWLNDLIEMNCDNLASLPVQCLGEFTLRYINDEENVNIFTESKQAEKPKRKEKRRKFCKLLSYFQTALNRDVVVAKQLMEYFMGRLCSPQSSLRGLVAKALNLVLCFNESMAENLSYLLKPNVETWLLGNLPTTENFQSVKKIACICLRSAILVETDPESVCCYIQFLAEYGKPGDTQTVFDLARLIIDRQALFKYITKDPHFRDDFLFSCIKLYYDYMISLENQVKEEWETENQSSNELVLVKWPTHSAVIHTLYIQGLLVLLTCEPPLSALDQYNRLITMWFTDSMPRGILVKTQEEAPLLNDWIRLKLLRSASPLIIEAALRDLETHQLVMFFQSFGLPAASMQRLLEALDCASETDPETVKSYLVDIGLAQATIEVQWMRGVKSGKKFANMLGYDFTVAQNPIQPPDPFQVISC